MPAVPGRVREGACEARRNPARNRRLARRVREGACPQAPHHPDQTATVIQTPAGAGALVRRLKSDGAGVREGAALGTSALPWGLLAVPKAAVNRRTRRLSPWRIGGEGTASPGGRFRLPAKACNRTDAASRRRVREGACPQAPHHPDQTATVIQIPAGAGAVVRRLRSDGAGVREGAALGTSALPWVSPCGTEGRRESSCPPAFAVADRRGRDGLPGRTLSAPRQSMQPNGCRLAEAGPGGRLSSSAAPHESDRHRNPDPRRCRSRGSPSEIGWPRSQGHSRR